MPTKHYNKVRHNRSYFVKSAGPIQANIDIERNECISFYPRIEPILAILQIKNIIYPKWIHEQV